MASPSDLFANLLLRGQQLGGGVLSPGGGIQTEGPGGIAAAPQGPGAPVGALPVPRPAAPAEREPGDLSDLNLLQKVGLVLSDFSAGAQGRPLASAQLIEQRRQEAERDRQRAIESFNVAQQLSGALRNVPLAQREAQAKALRGVYGRLFPRGEEIFDAFAAQPALSEDMLAQAAEDPTVAAYLQAPGATEAGLAKLLQDPEYLERSAQRADARLLPGVDQKVQQLLSSEDPRVRERLKSAQRDGFITIQELRQINESLPEGPEGLRLSEPELAVAERRQGDLSQRIPGFQTTQEFEAGRASEAKLAERVKLLELAEQSALRQKRAEIELEAELGPAPPKQTDIAGQRKEFTSQSKDFVKIRDSAARVNAAAKDPSAAGDLALIFNYMKILDPGSVVRESEFATAQNAGSVPDRIRGQYNRVISGERLSSAQRQDFLQQSSKLLAAQIKKQQQLERQYQGIAERARIDPRDVVVDYLGPLRQEAEDADRRSGAEKLGVTPAPSQSFGDPAAAAEIRRAFQAGEIDRETARLRLQSLQGAFDGG